MLKNLAANVNTPIGFFSLIVLVVESILGGLALLSSPEDKTFIIRSMVYILLLVILIVTILVYTKQEYFIQGNSQKLSKKTAKTPENEKYDIFISSPMASLTSDKEYQEEREQMLDLIKLLEKRCKFNKAFYAGAELDSQGKFSGQVALAADHDFNAIDNSDYFLLIYPSRLVSSVLVEAGYAIAKMKPCVFFVKNKEDLPYLLEHLHGIRNVEIYEYKTLDDIKDIINTDGCELFLKLKQ